MDTADTNILVWENSNLLLLTMMWGAHNYLDDIYPFTLTPRQYGHIFQLRPNNVIVLLINNTI